jgi:hypothetical protein
MAAIATSTGRKSFRAVTGEASHSLSLLDELVREGLRIQPRFVAEPIYSRTRRGAGLGFLRPAGVAEVAEAKSGSA